MILNVAMLFTLIVFILGLSNRSVITKERLSGTYKLSAYWLAKMTSEIPVLFLLPFLQWLIVYFMAGLPLNGGTVLKTLSFAFLGVVMSQVWINFFASN